MFTEFERKILIVDMPGHCDSDHFKKLFNFYYIREMAQKLNKFNFLIVLTIDDGLGELDPENIGMLKSFMDMFENAEKYVTFCINKAGKEFDRHQCLSMLESQIERQLGSRVSKYYREAIKSQRICFIPSAEHMEK